MRSPQLQREILLHGLHEVVVITCVLPAVQIEKWHTSYLQYGAAQTFVTGWRISDG
ncbi:MAG: hypothetical protein RMY31_011600 [Dendronalium sp. ChiSLP03b]|nr:hypothetical protein [Dendronalium sp. ChiSLP03b]